MRKEIAKLYIRFETGELTWVEFLRCSIGVCESLGEDAEVFHEFLEIMETTSYPDEKKSYQVVEIHCDYAAEIESCRG